MRTYFETPWSDTPNSHVKTFATQLDKRKLECSDFMVTISNIDKTVFFVGHMDMSGIYKNKFLEDYDKNEGEIWRTKKETGQKEYESAAALHKRNRDYNRNRNVGATQEAPTEASTAAMEYITELEERSAIQDRKTAKLENHS